MTDQTSGPRPRLRVSGFHWYSSQAGSALRRRPTDLLLLAACVLTMLVLAPFAPGPTAVDTTLAAALTTLPAWFTWIYSVGYAAAALWALLLLVAPVLSPRRRRLTAYLLLAAVIALGLAVAVGALAGTGWSESWAALWSANPPPVYTAVRVSMITAVIVSSSPHLGHPLRFVGRVLVGVVAVTAVGLGIAYPIGALAGFLVGVAAAAVVHLIIGSPAGRPSPKRVAGALSDLGLEDAAVVDLPSDRVGASQFSAQVADQPPLLVTVLGRDERDAQALSTAWTAATRRGERLSLTETRLARVEHAAMLSLLAERAGVRVLPVVAAGRSAEGDAVLVTRAPRGPFLSDLTPELVTDDILDEAWRQLSALHAAGIAHRRIDATRIVLDDGVPALTDFGQARAAADPQELMFDRAQLMAATALAGGRDRAVASALRVIGTEGLVELLPYLQPAVLDRDTRARIDGSDWDVPDLRGRVVAAVGVAAPPLEQLRRVSGKSLAQAAVLILVTYGLISVFAGVDFQEIWADLQSANWALLAAALVVAPMAAPFFAFSTIGATTAALRYYPVLMLQYALQFIALALPATAARIAMDIRFFQSFGVSAGASVSIGMIDSFSGFVVQVILLIVILLSGLPGFSQPLLGGSDSSDSSSSSSDSSDPSLLALMLAIGLMSLVVVLVVPSLRRQFVGRMKSAWVALLEQAHNAKGALGVLRHPKNVMQMLGGNLGGQVVQAIVLGICLMAFGESATLSQLILINTGVSLFAGLMPVPGGIGVAEAGYTAGLIAIGVPDSIAMSTAIAFRLVTFYLPPLWGSVAMKWLRTRSYL